MDKIENICPACKEPVNFTQEQLDTYDGYHLEIICPHCSRFACFVCGHVYPEIFSINKKKEIIMKRNFKLEMYVQDIDEEVMKEIVNIIECKASEAGAQAGGGYSEDPYDEDYQSSPEDFEEPELTTNNVETLKEILETIKDIRKSMEDLFPEVGNVQE